jgi:hypothetical protein
VKLVHGQEILVRRHRRDDLPKQLIPVDLYVRTGARAEAPAGRADNCPSPAHIAGIVTNGGGRFIDLSRAIRHSLNDHDIDPIESEAAG